MNGVLTSSLGLRLLSAWPRAGYQLPHPRTPEICTVHPLQYHTHVKDDLVKCAQTYPMQAYASVQVQSAVSGQQLLCTSDLHGHTHLSIPRTH